ncbi:MAG: HAD family hydrolase [Chloroflexi bacterium]|nr:HAD family hydrolase [Chloroflexota bacterium]MDL1882275.1 HAD family hydrolase [Anaerolineae bacterium CFX8]
MNITHILFDLYGTLADSRLMYPCYARQLGRVMAARYGGSPDEWSGANRRIVADWDSYYADLDLEGDDGINEMWEGAFRTTRALFRLTGRPEPEAPELAALARELPYLATRECDTLFPEARGVIERLHEAGYTLGIASHATSLQSRGTLEGGGLAGFFAGPILGPDVTGRFAKNRAYYLSAGLPPEQCLVVDDSPDGIFGAKAAGMQAVLLNREGSPPDTPADFILTGSLEGLPAYLKPA